jgi:predicted enzyme involved in methoxymalonyl-ACP biosynthesis
VEDGDLVVDNWVMSCRVFARTFEDYTLRCLVEEAVGRGCRRVRGRFAATAKNAYAARWLRERGLLDETTDAWALDTSSALPPTPALQAAVQTG